MPQAPASTMGVDLLIRNYDAIPSPLDRTKEWFKLLEEDERALGFSLGKGK